MHKYRVEVSMFPGQTRDVDGAELLDLTRQNLIVGEPVELDEDGEVVPAAEPETPAETPADPAPVDPPAQTDTTGKSAGSAVVKSTTEPRE